MNRSLMKRCFEFALTGVLVLTWLARAVPIFLGAEFSLDEFTYAHAGWLISTGETPYRDFVLFHPPLLPALFGLVFHLLPDEPTSILGLRLVMLAFFVVTVFGLTSILWRRYGAAAGIVPFLMLSARPLVLPLVQLRPDGAAFALAVLAWAVWMDRRGGSWMTWMKGAVTGVLLGAAACCSEKAVFYSLPVIVRAFGEALSFCAGRARGRGFVAGLAAAAAFAFGSLVYFQNGAQFWEWVIGWGMLHEREYPLRPWLPLLRPFVVAAWWVVALAGESWLRSCVEWRGLSEEDKTERQVLLELTVFALLSMAVQRGAYEYSIIPFAGMMVLAAGDAACRAVSAFLPGRWKLSGWREKSVGAACLGMALAGVCQNLPDRELRTNARQLAVLAEVGALTGAEDPVYDNCGSAVTRRSFGRLFFTDALLRTRLGGRLSTEVPREIVSSGTPAMVVDSRFCKLPEALRRFLEAHYVSYSPVIGIWGKRFPVRFGAGADAFVAIRDGDYFVQGEIPEGLSIDGQAVVAERMPLQKGLHLVRWKFARGEFFLLWLPRNGVRFQPAETKFCAPE